MDEHRPKVAVEAILVRDGKVLLGKRKGTHGAGEWWFPGGHLEYGENWEECAIRETYEETGLTVAQLQFVGVTNNVFPKNHKHYVSLFMAGVCTTGEPELREPDACERWEWFTWDELPEPHFSAIDELKSGGFNPNLL